MNRFKNIGSKLASSMSGLVQYFKTLPWWGKIIFIMVFGLCKLGPDFILFPLLLKWVNKQNKKKGGE